MHQRRSGCRNRFVVALAPTPLQNRSRLARASSGPPWASPEASRTALMAPALAPLTASSSRSSSSSSRSSTPQVNAPETPLVTERLSSLERRSFGVGREVQTGLAALTWGISLGQTDELQKGAPDQAGLRIRTGA